MSSPAIDYEALAKQHGAVVDYDALAAQHGAAEINPQGAQGLTWITDPDGNSMQVPFSTAAKILNNGKEYGGDQFFRSGQYRSGADTQGQKRGFMNSLSDTVGGMMGLGSQEEYNEKVQEANNPTVKGQTKQLLQSLPGVQPITGIVKGAAQSGSNTLESLGNVRDAVSRARAALAKGDTETAEAQLEDANGHLTMAAGHALATATSPVGGGQAEQIGAQLGNKDVGGALGTATPLVAPILLHAAGDAAAPAAGRVIRATGRGMEAAAEPVGEAVGSHTGGAAAGGAIGYKAGGPVGAGVGAATGAAVSKAVGRGTTSLMRTLGQRLSQSNIGWDQTPTKYAEPIGPQLEPVERNAADFEPSSDNPQVEGLRPPARTPQQPTSTEDTEGVTNPQAEQAANLPHPHNSQAYAELMDLANQRRRGGLEGNAIGYERAANAIRDLGEKPFSKMSDEDLAKLPGIGPKSLPVLQSLKKVFNGVSEYEAAAKQEEESPITPEFKQAVNDRVARLKTNAHNKLELPQGNGLPERPAPAINEEPQGPQQFTQQVPNIVGSQSAPLNFMGAQVYKVAGRWFSKDPGGPGGFRPVIDPRIAKTLDLGIQTGQLK